MLLEAFNNSQKIKQGQNHQTCKPFLVGGLIGWLKQQRESGYADILAS